MTKFFFSRERVRRFVFTFLLSSVFLSGLLYSSVFAATKGSASLVLQPSVMKSPIGALIKVKMVVQSNFPLNAYHATVTYPETMLRFVRFDTKNSVVDIWHSEPNGKTPGALEFTGGSTKALATSSGLLGTIIFQTLASGSATLTLPRPEIYIADGLGTKADVNAPAVMITVTTETVSSSVENGGIDVAPPTIMKVSMTDDPFNAKQKIVGVTSRDAETGIQATFAREKTGFFWNEWAPVNNSFAIDKDTWALAIRTIDNAGNEEQQVIYNWPILFRNILVPLLLVLGIMLFVFFSRWYGNRKRKR